MTLQDLSPNAQDYLKMIWDLLEWDHTPVQPSALARKAHVSPSTISGAVSRLVSGGYARHNPYGAIELTERGERYAVRMVRKHRLLETFLVTTLGYSWDEVHAEADALEHSASDLMINRIDILLGHPQTDPHGDPIPRIDGSLPQRHTIALSEAPAGKVRIERVSDEDPNLLRELNAHGIGLHSLIHVEPAQHTPDASAPRTVSILAASAHTHADESDTPVSVAASNTAIILPPEACERIRVSIPTA